MRSMMGAAVGRVLCILSLVLNGCSPCMQADKLQTFRAVNKAAGLSRTGGVHHTSGLIWF